LSASENLAERAERQGWREALSGAFSGEELDLAAHPERAAFIQLMRARDGGTVLEVGAGFGNITLELAKAGFRVVAVEPRPERARFIAVRARQESLPGQIEVLEQGLEGLGEGKRFDAIVVNEAASSDKLELARLKGLLAPGGVIYLGGRNSISWSGPVGGRSHSGYERLFARAGLRIRATYVSPRGFRNPSELVPLSEQAIRHYTRMRLEPPGASMRGRLKNASKSALASVAFWKLLAPDFVFFLEASDA
jgi:predicted O-methyltransferase YrrM